MSDGMGVGKIVIAKEVVREIESLIKDYYWMDREIHRLEGILYRGRSSERSWGVAQYGLEAAMPKGSGGISKTELAAMDDKEEIIINRIKKLAKKVEAVEIASDNLKDEIHKTVLDCIMDRMSYRAIAKHLNVSRDRVKQIKDEIIHHFSQNDQIRQVLKI